MSRQLSVKLSFENAFESFGFVGSYTVMQSCPNLQKLRIMRAGGNSQTKLMDGQAIQTLLQSAPTSLQSLQLKVRHLSETALAGGMQYLPNLTELSVSCSSMNEEGLEHGLLAAAGNLKTLYLQGEWIGEKTLKAVAGLRNLGELGLICRGGIQPSWLLNLPSQSFSSLKCWLVMALNKSPNLFRNGLKLWKLSQRD
ncbi:hypothetical protein BC829DRAFT_155765 [Chytridium lagenaria]|nr:hypothetical protein BC829DRAFT_155765 [Chytridium lagenaria]